MDFRRLLGNATLANQLTFLRLVAIPFFILAVLDARFGVAFVLFVAAAVTDLLDGLAARVLVARTTLGSFIDPAADKLLLVSAFVLLTDYPVLFSEIPMTNRLPLTLTVLAISRDVLIVGIALVLYLAYGTTRFVPTVWGKLTTLVELLTVSLFLLFNWLDRHSLALDAAIWVCLSLILVSGFNYLWLTLRRVRSHEPTTPGGSAS